MGDPQDDRPVLRSQRRDLHVREVSRVTRAVAAVAVLGTATFGGLAAAGTDTTSASTQSSSQSGGLAAPATAPTSSAQAPVASSGGS